MRVRVYNFCAILPASFIGFFQMLVFLLFIITIIYQSTISCDPQDTMPKTFLYFAYGSNLLAKRIHINNPSAVRNGSGLLNNFRLDFNRHTSRWNGCVATIVPHEGHYVWGAIWEIDLQHLPSLDQQEGVPHVYFRFEVDIELPNGKFKRCYTYQLVDTPTKYYKLSELPEDRQPSFIYLNTIIKGAIESELPHEYVELLKTTAHNGYNGTVF